ncbi:MAG: bifunctional 4-hydroxy-2-oxoglutarate aldolase/2-dehydro-3-deoxy-phosphogluconate aldolase [Bacteroidales bacterium]
MKSIENLIVDSRLVPVFNHKDAATGCRVVQACYDAGLRVFEWTNRGVEAAGLFRVIRDYINRHCPGMALGAGSVFDGPTCREFHGMQADFIVSPILDPEMASVCKELNTLWIPGCGTLTEIHQAQKWGAGIIKIFPGDSIGGPGFVKAIRGPMPWARLMPTGGVSPDYDNLKAWFDAGVVCVGMGSRLFTKELITNSEALREAIVRVREVIEGIVNSDR